MKEIICYCIEHMSDKDNVHLLFDNLGIRYRKSGTYQELAEIYRNSEVEIPLTDFISFYRDKWIAAPIESHIQNLRSGLLRGHSWHQAMPSMLHLSMQNKVRECINGDLSLEELVNIGADIMKHEYFMVATHDICETTIINTFPNTIPPIGNKSITDFVFEGIPYDLKVSTYPDGWDKSNKAPRDEYIKTLASMLYAGADKARMRKQAEKANSNWAFNRFYIMVENQDRWLTNPQEMLDEMIRKVCELSKPQEIIVNEIHVLVQLIEL